MAITDEVLNELLIDYHKPENLLGQDGLLKQLQETEHRITSPK